jgi:hypothetical protein
MKIHRLDSGSVIYEGVHCRLTIERPRPGIVLMTISGRDVGEFGDAPMSELLNGMDIGEPMELFIDARNAQGASLDVSNDWAQWLGKQRARFRQINMLTGSRFVQITADFVRRFAALADIMRIYTEGTAFDDALAESKRNLGER